MAEKKIEWTEQQKRAIGARGSDVLVTASAGTGKTAVLSGRCVDIVSDKSICPDVWSILVLTFTEAAAEQMRSRIAEQLRETFVQNRDSHLRHQLILLQGADISTIHSFCKRLITEHFYIIGLDPTFSVIDSDEQRLLKTEVLEKTIDWAWQQNNIRAALEQLLYRRDLRTNNGFLARIIELSDFLDGVVSRENWYERAARLAEVTNPLVYGLGQKQRQIITEKLQDVLSQLRHAKKVCESEGTDVGWAERLQTTHLKPVAECIEILEADDWDKCTEVIRNFNKPKTYKPKGLHEPSATLMQRTAKRAVDTFKDLSQLAVVNPDYLDRLGDSVGLQTKVLVELVKKFDRLYSQAKRAVNCLDFADLEHYALKLLTDENSSADKPLPSEIALGLRQKYKHIFVDEYQDINSVQQRIFDMLSPGGNVLEVGDVKQSIYAFRGAEPDIFLKQLKLASPDVKDAQNGLRVDLNANFRSAKEILDFVNTVFSRIMTASFTKIDYDESARLKPALTDKSEPQALNDNKNIVEFHILDETKTGRDLQSEKNSEPNDAMDLNLVTSRQRQAAMIARRIRQMVGADTGKPEFQIYDKQQDTFRDVQYRDIVVLMRSLAKKANDYVEVFRLAGVPVSCQATAGYFEATEISDFTALLKVLDNPQRDIEFAAVLRSPFFKVSDTELAKIKVQNRAEQRHRNYYDCVLQYCSCGADTNLSKRLKMILDQIQQWRTVARRGNLADLIWRIYRETNFLSFVSALPNGQARRANLLKLHDRAMQFEGFASSSGVPSLTRFVEFIEKLQESGQDWAPAEPETSAGNAVRILSVHKSKGLEFPVVFLAELESRFNMKDVQADCLADANDTLGLQIIDRKSNSKLKSIAHEVIAEQKLSMALAEEMRILYVATTRARERLVLTASPKNNNCGEIISNGFFFGAESIPDWQLRACRSPLEWILYGLSDQKVLHDAFETGLAERVVCDDLFSFILYDQADLKQLSEFIIKLKANKLARSSARSEKSRQKPTGSKLLTQVKKSLLWEYQFGNASLLPAKNSVTQLTHNSDEYIKFNYSRALDRQPSAVMKAEPILNEFPDPRLIGTATHLVISQLDLAFPVTKDAIEKTKEKLLAENAITATVGEHIDTESIQAFFESELGGIVIDTSNTFWREWSFTFAMPACEFTDSSYEQQTSSSEVVVVQGIIDMLVRTPQGLVVIDFKTDKITAGQVSRSAELYRRQLELYSRAASAILKSKSIAKWLYFLTPRCSIEA
ncbi:MAG: helicase-exonuclease AddAB subunit AddA [Planctomycetota bacterium]|jgi:ATP-dependent helicase/nuclease subunit A